MKTVYIGLMARMNIVVILDKFLLTGNVQLKVVIR